MCPTTRPPSTTSGGEWSHRYRIHRHDTVMDSSLPHHSRDRRLLQFHRRLLVVGPYYFGPNRDVFKKIITYSIYFNLKYLIFFNML